MCVLCYAVSADIDLESISGSGSGSGIGPLPSEEPLTAGEITGIVIASVVVVAAIVLVIFGVGAWW